LFVLLQYIYAFGIFKISYTCKDRVAVCKGSQRRDVYVLPKIYCWPKYTWRICLIFLVSVIVDKEECRLLTLSKQSYGIKIEQPLGFFNNIYNELDQVLSGIAIFYEEGYDSVIFRRKQTTSFPLKYSIEAIKRNNRLWIELYEFIELTLKFPYIFATLQQTKIVNYFPLQL
jgi:hypothetical protein